jgi:hypothetical protein
VSWARLSLEVGRSFRPSHLLTDDWVARQPREATPFGRAPRFLIRTRDGKVGEAFARVARRTSIEILKIPYHAPLVMAVCERFFGCVRGERLGHMLVVGQRHRPRTVAEYAQYFGQALPLQGIAQETSERIAPESVGAQPRQIVAIPVLSGLHQDCPLAA